MDMLCRNLSRSASEDSTAGRHQQSSGNLQLWYQWIADSMWKSKRVIASQLFQIQPQSTSLHLDSTPANVKPVEKCSSSAASQIIASHPKRIELLQTVLHSFYHRLEKMTKKSANPVDSSVETNILNKGGQQQKSSEKILDSHAEEISTSVLIPDATKKLQMKTIVNKASLQSRTRFLVKSIERTASNMSRLMRVEELSQHLKRYPQACSIAVKEKAVKQLLIVKESSKDESIQEAVRETLTLLGHVDPPKGRGVRILTMDGGGLRGMVAIEVMRTLEQLTGRPIRDLFDYICGVSTGGILAVLTGTLVATPDACEKLYKTIGSDVFKRNAFWGTGKLVLNHAFYDTQNWTKLLRTRIGEKLFIETSRDAKCPKIAVISTVVNQPRLQAFIFRNYDYSPRVQSHYPGSHEFSLCDGVRASAAAPGYFEECRLADFIHQDGGIMVNNPTALSIHESKLLWPAENIQCVVSIGSGRYEPPVTAQSSANYTGLKDKFLKILDSATDTEAVHTMLHDLLPRGMYFRFNPYLSEAVALDETRPEKIAQLQQDARLYLRKNDHKIKEAAQLLTQNRSFLQKSCDYLKLKATVLL